MLFAFTLSAEIEGQGSNFILKSYSSTAVQKACTVTSLFPN